MPWEICTTRTFNKGALNQRRLGKDGFSNQLSKAFLARCLWEFPQQSYSTGGPLSKEGLARMASTNKSPRHFVQDALGNLHNKDIQQGSPSPQKVGQGWLQQPTLQGIFCKMSWAICTTITFNRGALKHRRLGKDGITNQIYKAFCGGFRQE